MIKDLLNKRKYITVSTVGLQLGENEIEERPNIPNGMWSKCNNCGKIIYTEDLKNNLQVCSNCNYHFRIGAYERINFLVDKDSFKEFNRGLIGNNPLNFPDYEEKIKASSRKSSTNEAVVTGEAKIFSKKIVLCVMDSNFMMGSMGIAVGEKITNAIEYATKNKFPLIIFTCSGGARMQEGIFSLMQMAKISGAIARHSQAGLLYLTILTDPTTGGVTASFAMEGDIILSEPRCLVGFAGRRVIEKTINEKLPNNFQTSEFLLEKGFIDKIVNRKEIKSVINTILKIHEVKIYE
ncbi:acetyl-CoA carboxylase, carboxyltransferase subunit beta [Clostridium tarantellae]|uniref:Acetyl-coenzyme A carboxylase carboxyl transferase subunit beta n=1 Tax=Clostridium tarantellae TaxID=39493 RepID=A0A6I1MLM3_9CLOT|nr:acetyl-CoA carboxylase, carboxyltransferase subunit beta [Clostridium tarantellae]MPQ43904.1 acetyl-CoA carboxylase carboxyltransferase subunit beta [Clostridium tarantellae]